jgi:hypothetical protein
VQLVQRGPWLTYRDGASFGSGALRPLNAPAAEARQWNVSRLFFRGRANFDAMVEERSGMGSRAAAALGERAEARRLGSAARLGGVLQPRRAR